MPIACTAPRTVSAASRPGTLATGIVIGAVVTMAPTGFEMPGVSVSVAGADGETAKVSNSTEDWPAGSDGSVHDTFPVQDQPGA